MGPKYLIDSNTVIDYLDNKLPEKSAKLLDGIDFHTSVIVRMELLSWHEATEKQLKVLQEFIDNSIVFGLEEAIILKAIDIRKNHRVKLPDAIVGATALVNGQILITHNVSDFKNITGLQVIDSWLL
jgi:predicted nucleic acid-binding protein